MGRGGIVLEMHSNVSAVGKEVSYNVEQQPKLLFICCEAARAPCVRFYSTSLATQGSVQTDRQGSVMQCWNATSHKFGVGIATTTPYLYILS